MFGFSYNFVYSRRIEAELDGVADRYLLPRATPDTFYKQCWGDGGKLLCKVRHIEPCMLMPNPNATINQTNCIGNGVFGACFKHSLQGFPVCVKILNDQTEQGKISLQNEAIALLTLCHPAVCWLWGMQTKSVPYFLVTTLYTIRGVSLTMHTLLSPSTTDGVDDVSQVSKCLQTKMNCSQWTKILENIGHALAYLKSKRLLHRDLKNDNIVIREENDRLSPVIVDFGKCIHEAEARKYCLTENERLDYKRNHPHIAPDLVSGESLPSPCSEIYSFGRIIRDVVKYSSKVFPACMISLYKKCMMDRARDRPEIEVVLDILIKADVSVA